jgi:cyanophycinase
MRIGLMALIAYCLFSASALAAACGPEGALPPATAPRSMGPAHGHLLMVGGGGTTPDIDAELARLAGGDKARWVVIPTASDDTEIPGLHSENSVSPLHQPFTVLHTRDKVMADTEAFAAPLRSATAVWFEGGRQTRIVDAYAGTRTERELRALLDRGGLIAGTSAGATIQGSRLVRGGSRGSIMTGPGYKAAFGYVDNLAVDQHVDAWHRESDLAALIADSPGLLGIGLDERTALAIEGNTARVLGAGRALITDGVDHGGSPTWCLRAGQALDLARWASLPNAHATTINP